MVVSELWLPDREAIWRLTIPDWLATRVFSEAAVDASERPCEDGDVADAVHEVDLRGADLCVGLLRTAIACGHSGMHGTEGKRRWLRQWREEHGLWSPGRGEHPVAVLWLCGRNLWLR